MPAVTIGLPFYNEAEWLADAVRSMLGQSFTDFELLLLDDGSSDASLEVARSFRDPRIKIIASRERRHLPARLNELARCAEGRFIARMDADDLSHPTRLAREMALFERDETLDAVGTGAAMIDEASEPFAVVGFPLAAPTMANALESGALVHASLLARREWVLANPYDELLTRAEDRDLWVRTTPRSRFAVVEAPLLTVRVHSSAPGFFDGYAESHRQNRLLFLRYGPEAVGYAKTARLWLGSHAKVAAMGLATAAGLEGRLVQRRGRPPTSEERRLVAETLAAVR